MQSEKMGHQNITKEMKYTIVDELYRSIRNHNHKNTKTKAHPIGISPREQLTLCGIQNFADAMNERKQKPSHTK